jgi:glycosyltransferase involved in cell wall biosynthesis
VRILFVTHYCVPHLGGIEVLSITQAKALVKRGHEVIIISSRTKQEPIHESIDGVRIIRVNAWNFLEEKYGVPYPIFLPRFFYELYLLLKEIDLCLIHSFGFISSLIAAILCKKDNIPYLLIQNNQFVKYNSPFLNLLEYLNDQTSGKFVIKNASKLFAVSIKTKEYIEELSKRDVTILPNPIDINIFSFSSDKYNIRYELNLPLDKFIVFSSGRLVYKKSMITILYAANMLRNDKRFLFLVAGDGSDKSALEDYIVKNKLDNCLLVGNIPHTIIDKYYKTSDIYLLPSKVGEGWPISLLEALASNLPIITTAIGGQAESIRHKQNGFLIDTESPEQIVDILKEYIDKPYQLSIIASKGREVVKENSIENHIKQLDSIINSYQVE